MEANRGRKQRTSSLGGASLIRPPLVLDPAAGVASLRIVVRPVHHAAFRVPFVFAVKGDRIAGAQRIDAPRQIDVVGHQQRLSGIQLDDEALMTAAIVVVGQKLHHHALAGKLLVAETVGKSISKGGVATLSGS